MNAHHRCTPTTAVNPTQLLAAIFATFSMTQWVSAAIFAENGRHLRRWRHLRRSRTAPFEDGGCKSLIYKKMAKMAVGDG
jgi:hypothetical protein